MRSEAVGESGADEWRNYTFLLFNAFKKLFSMFSGKDIEFYFGDSIGVVRFISAREETMAAFCLDIVSYAILFGISIDSLKSYLLKKIDDDFKFLKEFDQHQSISSLQKQVASLKSGLLDRQDSDDLF